MPDPLLCCALRGEPVPRPPVWLMRQAGRYLPEYQELRKKHSFLELCHHPELAAEVTLQPLRRFDLDAGIVFSDILLPFQSMGLELSYGTGHGPQIANPVRCRDDVEALAPFHPSTDLPEPLEAIRLSARASGLPIIGFAGAPFTMACYAIQGRGSPHWDKVKAMAWGQPDTFEALLHRIAVAVGDHLQAQVDAGAAAVQLFDTWAGALTRPAYRRWAAKFAKLALDRVHGAPTLYYTRDAGTFLPVLADVQADAYGLDWRVDLGEARRVLGLTPVQGNLDPDALAAPEPVLRAEVRRIIEEAGPTGHVFNLGHGCRPSTPIEGVATVVDEVRKWRWDR